MMNLKFDTLEIGLQDQYYTLLFDINRQNELDKVYDIHKVYEMDKV